MFISAVGILLTFCLSTVIFYELFKSKGSQKDAEGALTDTVRNEGKGLLSSVEKEGVVV